MNPDQSWEGWSAPSCQVPGVSSGCRPPASNKGTYLPPIANMTDYRSDLGAVDPNLRQTKSFETPAYGDSVPGGYVPVPDELTTQYPSVGDPTHVQHPLVPSNNSHYTFKASGVKGVCWRKAASGVTQATCLLSNQQTIDIPLQTPESLYSRGVADRSSNPNTMIHTGRIYPERNGCLVMKLKPGHSRATEGLRVFPAHTAVCSADLQALIDKDFGGEPVQEWDPDSEVPLTYNTTCGATTRDHLHQCRPGRDQKDSPESVFDCRTASNSYMMVLALSGYGPHLKIVSTS